MKVTRRDFLKATGLVASGLLLPTGSAAAAAAAATATIFPLHKRVGEATSVCPYCSVGCGVLIATDVHGHIVNTEGDPDNVHNRGALCSKAQSITQLSTDPRRLRRVLYRAPHSTTWEEKSWDWAIAEIARRVKATRDATFREKDGEVTVNRTEGIAWLGGAANNTEDCYLAAKFARALGIVYLEHQARLCHSSTVGALASSFGRGAMTNHWVDLKNSDVILVMGSNPAENHPISFHWITRAIEERGARLIVADPRFTRSAAKADLYVPFRSGTDIAFIGGLINYAIQNRLYNEEYVKAYTNALTLIHPDYQGPDELDGLFVGYDPQTRTYDSRAWQYQTEKVKVKLKERDASGNEVEVEKEAIVPRQAASLEDPHTVFSILKRHFARYTPEMVERICGTPRDRFLEVASLYCSTGAPDKAGTILYAMGTTQHTVGVQNIRAYAILQLLLGNIGIPGGGVNALRGESNVQGSTDMGLLYHDLPGYLGLPTLKQPDYQAFIAKYSKTSFWANGPRFFNSLMKAWFGDAATSQNNFAYDYLPKRSGDYSFIPMFEALHRGTIKGMFVMGQNPFVSGPNARFERQAFANLDWLVVMELFDTETASFWRAPGVNSASIQTEVFLLPAADAMEKAGSVVNSGRVIQWRNKVANPPGEAREDIWILDQLLRAIKAAYQGSTAERDRPILDLVWDYGDPPQAERVAREINGYALEDVKDASDKVLVAAGAVVPSFATIASAANPEAIACGAWIYSGYWAPADDGTGVIMPAARRRGQSDPGGIGTHPFWAWTWPANRHIVYNRASARPDGTPWSEAKKLIWWDATQKKWTGYDVPDFAVTRAPDAQGNPAAVGLAAQSGTDAFLMKPDGKAWLFAPSGTNEGPLPEHYEPFEAPVANPLSRTQFNPVVKVFDTNRGLDIGDNVGTPDRFPIVCTTFRLTEHWQAGAMTRYLPWPSEAQPGMFVEISNALAAERGIRNGELIEVVSARGAIRAVAMVTARWKPYTIDGRLVHHIGMPWHFAWQGIARGASANDLTPHVGDGNTNIPEYKAFLVDVRKI
ncbi:MAG: formate dehydrogenase-N subunit alpha [Chloroflexaceae bacterium]